LVSANRAECAALASFAPNGLPLSEVASGSGVAVGYGIVSVAPQLIAHAQTPSVLLGQSNQNTKPKLQKPARYQHRFAWMVVMKEVEEYHGGPISTRAPSTSSPASHQPPSFGYVIFLMDARTGSDALLYAEGQPGATGGSVTVPVERISVPWTLISRSPNGYVGTIRATVLPCDGYPSPVGVDRYQRAAAVIVERRVGARCGAAKQVTLALHAAVVTWNLPPHIAHDPIGPYVTLPTSSPPGGTYTSHCSAPPRLVCSYDGPDSTGGALWNLQESDNGNTIHVKRGSVFAVGPLHDVRHYAALPVASSDTGVLGVLFPDYELHEFRAWQSGHADLYVPTSTCDPPKGEGLPCTPPWIVHLIIK
jgi:hypothetical protein